MPLGTNPSLTAPEFNGWRRSGSSASTASSEPPPTPKPEATLAGPARASTARGSFRRWRESTATSRSGSSDRRGCRALAAASSSTVMSYGLATSVGLSPPDRCVQPTSAGRRGLAGRYHRHRCRLRRWAPACGVADGTCELVDPDPGARQDHEADAVGPGVVVDQRAERDAVHRGDSTASHRRRRCGSARSAISPPVRPTAGSSGGRDRSSTT